MGTTTDKLNKILESKAAIKAAIEAKGVSDVGDVLSAYPDKIASIKSSGYTGHADVEGLKAIGWTDEDIEYYQTHGVNWNEEDDIYHKVPQDNIDLYGVLTINNIQEYADRIVYLPKIDVSKLSSGNFAFFSSLIAIPMLDTNNMKIMGTMFDSCYCLVSIPKLYTDNTINMDGMFMNCYSLISVPMLDMSNVTASSSMFMNCYSLISVPMLDMSNIEDASEIFYRCYSLHVANLKGLKTSISFSESSLLQKESLLYTIQNAASTSAITITLSAYCYNKYSADPDVVAALSKQPNVSLASA